MQANAHVYWSTRQNFFKLDGWTYDNKPELWSKKQVVIGFPHTTNMDTVRAVALFNAINLKTNTLIKKELFFGHYLSC